MQRTCTLLFVTIVVALAVGCSSNDDPSPSETVQPSTADTPDVTDTQPTVEPATAGLPTEAPSTATIVPPKPANTPLPPRPTVDPCDRQSYPDVCIPRYPPDLDCGEVSFRRFRVLPPDPHGFDRDGDGVGCETG